MDESPCGAGRERGGHRADRSGSPRVAIRERGLPAELEWRLDPDLIEQVLVNLLVNGCEASPPGAQVELRAARATTERWRCRVRPRHRYRHREPRDRLFHPFFTTKPDGNGLGLAISRNIVREHGGQIDVLPQNGRGSVFRVLLPRAEAHEPVRPDRRRRRADPPLAAHGARRRRLRRAAGRQRRRRARSSPPSRRTARSSTCASATSTASRCCAHARATLPSLKAIVITAHGDVDSAVQCAPPRRLRLHPQAVRSRGDHRVGEERAAHRRSSNTRSRTSAAQRSRPDLRQPGDARRHGAGRQGRRAAGAGRPHPRRDGHRARSSSRARFIAPSLAARDGPVHRPQLLGHSRAARRERAVRPRARRVLRRARAEARARRAGRRRHALSRRDRRPARRPRRRSCSSSSRRASSAASAARPF